MFVVYIKLCLIYRNGWTTWCPTHPEDSSWAGAQSSVSDGQQVTLKTRGAPGGQEHQELNFHLVSWPPPGLEQVSEEPVPAWPGRGRSVYMYLHVECSWCLFRHVDLSACSWVWSHCESILQSRQSAVCVHDNTHTVLLSIYSSFSWTTVKPNIFAACREKLNYYQCLPTVFLSAVSPAATGWQYLHTCSEEQEDYSHEEVFISDQMDCANDLFSSVFIQQACVFLPLHSHFI